MSGTWHVDDVAVLVCAGVQELVVDVEVVKEAVVDALVEEVVVAVAVAVSVLVNLVAESVVVEVHVNEIGGRGNNSNCLVCMHLPDSKRGRKLQFGLKSQALAFSMKKLHSSMLASRAMYSPSR